MIPRLNLTPEQIAYAKARYRKHRWGHGAAKIAAELGVSYDGLMRHLSSEYRKRRNKSALAYYHRNSKSSGRPCGKPSNTAKYALARAKVTLVSVKMVDNSSSRPPVSPNQF